MRSTAVDFSKPLKQFYLVFVLFCLLFFFRGQGIIVVCAKRAVVDRGRLAAEHPARRVAAADAADRATSRHDVQRRESARGDRHVAHRGVGHARAQPHDVGLRSELREAIKERLGGARRNEGQPLLSMLDRVGAPRETLGDSTGKLQLS